MSAQPEQQPVDLADIARRAGAEALAALIEAARGKPSAVTVAAAKALIELGAEAGDVGDGHRGPVTFTMTGSKQPVEDREPIQFHHLSDLEFEVLSALLWKAAELSGHPGRNGHAVGYTDIDVTVVADEEQRLEYKVDCSRLSAETKEDLSVRRRAKAKPAPPSQPWIPRDETPPPTVEPIESTAPPVPPRSEQPPAPPVICGLCAATGHDARQCPGRAEWERAQASLGWTRTYEGGWS